MIDDFRVEFARCDQCGEDDCDCEEEENYICEYCGEDGCDCDMLQPYNTVHTCAGIHFNEINLPVTYCLTSLS